MNTDKITSDKEPKAIRAFHWLSRAWYYEANRRLGIVDIINIGMYYPPDGGCDWEASITWHELNEVGIPCVEVYDDGWQMFRDWPDVLNALAEIHGTEPSPEDIAKLLLSLGFSDITKKKDDNDTA